MARSITGTGYTSHGTLGNWNPTSEMTLIYWYRQTGPTIPNAWLTRKRGNAGFDVRRKDQGAGDNFQLFWSGSPNLFYNTSTAIGGQGEWCYLAISYAAARGDGDRIRFYFGSLTTPATLQPLLQIFDSTSLGSAAGEPFEVGDRFGGSNADGDYASLLAIDRALEEEEIRSLQFQPRVVPNTVLYTELGWGLANSDIDWSGNGYHSTTFNSPPIVPHVPIGSRFGRKMGNIIVSAAPPAFQPAWASGANQGVGYASV